MNQPLEPADYISRHTIRIDKDKELTRRWSQSHLPRPTRVLEKQHDLQKIVKLNIGGVSYQTTQDTLLRGGNVFFAKLLAEDKKDETGSYFIDRDGTYFGPLLAYLRTGHLHISPTLVEEKVHIEAEFYRIHIPPIIPHPIKETKIIMVQYHSLDDIATFRNKTQMLINKQAQAGWKYVNSNEINCGSLQAYGVDNNLDVPPTWFLYFRRMHQEKDPPNFDDN